MKVHPNVLASVLKLVSLDGELDPVVLSFEPDGVTVAQMNTSRDIFVAARISRDLFDEYEAVGTVKLPYTVVKALDKAFKLDSEVSISFADGRAVVSGKKETYSERLSEEDVPVGSYSDVDGILSLPKVAGTITHVFTVPSHELELSIAPRDVQAVQLVYSPGKLRVIAANSLTEYTRAVPAQHVKGEEERAVAVAVAHYNKLVKLLSGDVTIAFTASPVMFTYRGDRVKATFTVSEFKG